MTGETVYRGDQVVHISSTGFIQIGRVIELLHDREAVKILIHTSMATGASPRSVSGGTGVVPCQRILVLK